MQTTNHPWLHSYPENIDWQHNFDPRPLYSLLEESAFAFPYRPAIDFLGKTYNYSELHKLVLKTAGGLERIGVKKGTKVGLLLPNCPLFVIAYFAILRLGGIVVNYNPLYSLRELRQQIDDSETSILFTLDLKLLYHKASTLLHTTLLEKIIVGSMEDMLPFPKNVFFKIKQHDDIATVLGDKRVIPLGTLLENAPSPRPVAIDPYQDSALLQYTGGTTGTPKGAMLSHANLHTNVMQTHLWLPTLEEGRERILVVLPLFHVFAMTAIMNLGIKKAACMVLHPRFYINNVIKDMRHKHITLLPGVPTLFSALLNEPTAKPEIFASLKLGISGGAPLPASCREQFEHLSGCRLLEGYGLTECSPIVTVQPSHITNKPNSIGLPLPGTLVEIRDPDNHMLLKPKQIGEICVQGPQVMQGYFRKGNDTAATLKDNILHTGDLGYMDEEGFIFVVDRLKEMIIAGGYKIYPRNVEEAIYMHSAVKEAAVIGVEDPYRGQTVKAFIVCKDNHIITREALHDFLQGKLAAFEIPTDIECVSSLPKTMIGKIAKKDLPR